MTFNEAILKSLDDRKTLSTYSQIYEHILANNYRDFGKAKTPDATISALLGEFIRKNDSRIKRVKKEGSYHYYLTKYENELGKLHTKRENYFKSRTHQSTKSVY